MASNMRIGGLASGMDIDDMVSRLMKAHRMPFNQLIQKKQQLEWQRDDYRAMNSKVLDLRNAAFNMKLQSSYQARKVAVADESILTATASSSSNEGIYSIRVDRLATSATLNSGALGAGGDDTKTLGSLNPSGLGTAPMSGDSVLTIGGDKGTAAITLKSTTTVAQLVADINGKSNLTGVKVTYDKTMDKLFFASSTTGDNSKINLNMRSIVEDSGENLLKDVLNIGTASSSSNTAQIVTATGTVTFMNGTVPDSTKLIDSTLTSEKKFTISVGGGTPYEFKVTSSTTIGQLIQNINTSDLGKTGVSAYLDNAGHLAFYNPSDDPTKALTFGSDGGLVAKVGLDSTNVTDDVDVSTVTASGLDARIEFNGSGTLTEYANNTFNINGMTITAKATGGPTNLTVTQDVDAVYNSIKAFVDKYNKFVEDVNKELGEKKYRDFLPLTDEQKSEMKDKDIERWEEKARSGMLSGDSILTKGLTDFRNAFSNVVEGLPTGQLKSMSEIGISSSIVIGKTISGNYLEKGKLYIDDAKLKEAIANKPDEVMKLFLSDDGDKDSTKGDGIANRIYNAADTLMGKIKSKAGNELSPENTYLMGKETNRINKEMDKLTIRLDALETRYYKQFTAMEKYINQMNTQSSWLAQQFGGQG